ncbi:MAG: ABC transporter ATP-binding protein [Actinomycetota bacterium]
MAGSGSDHLRDEVVLRVEDLVVQFPAPHGETVHAVSGVSFDLDGGETLGIVGESGCGKTTVGRAVMQLEPATDGRVELHGDDLTSLRGERLRQVRRDMQMIFQDPVSSINPSRRIRDVVREGLDMWAEKDGPRSAQLVDEILVAVGLGGDDVGERRAHEFSGGQCQRICIARALVMDPKVLILDEPVSALDVSVQAQILNLLEQLKQRFGLTMVFISHDLAVVKNVSDRVLVMYLGKVCEIAQTDQLFDAPTHPYTQALLASIPGNRLGLPPADELISGELPSPLDPPSGCRFRTRCPHADERCASDEPALVEHQPGHWVACHHPQAHLRPRGDDQAEAS